MNSMPTATVKAILLVSSTGRYHCCVETVSDTGYRKLILLSVRQIVHERAVCQPCLVILVGAGTSCSVIPWSRVT